jgi:hypothetical protein
MADKYCDHGLYAYAATPTWGVAQDGDGTAIGYSTSGGTAPSASEVADAVWAQSTGAAVATRMAEAWGRLGLDPSKPLVSGQTEISFGAIVMALAGTDTITVTRQ